MKTNTSSQNMWLGFSYAGWAVKIAELVDKGRYRWSVDGLTVVPAFECSRLSDEEWLAALKRARELIAAGLPFDAFDCDETGDKSTEASWGMCSESLDLWPSFDLHMWPVEFITQGRRAHRSSAGGVQRCPFDRDPSPPPYGCFYRCQIFSPPRRGSRPTRDEAIAAYDREIAELTARLRLTSKLRVVHCTDEHA